MNSALYFFCAVLALAAVGFLLNRYHARRLHDAARLHRYDRPREIRPVRARPLADDKFISEDI